MLERMLLPEHHAIAILLKDHDKVKELFDAFERAKSTSAKEKIIAAAVAELKIHAILEEEIFYPAVRRHVGKDLMNEADEEHHVARVLIAELDQDGRANDHRDAKFTVLSESVRHHIKDEEGEVLPKAKRLKIDFEALGEQMLKRKASLIKNGIPSDAEHAMVAAAHGGGDTPAATARRRPGTGRKRAVTKKSASKRGARSRRSTR
jgi:hemerythrin-like domain-containing protein